ncbi:zinc-binding dehydrogenase, partial [Candidatus Bathyarchaeota archaeon]|nr:zinc-binding dehydrogenase [Candidatus Bathyarchaeota archaeon]
PIFCAGITVWDALERAELKNGETIAIIGLGGLGAMAAKYARQLGARVIALDVRDEQLLAVKDEGSADEIINTTGLSTQELQMRVAMVNGGALVQKAIVASGASQAYDTSLAITGAEATVVAVGLAPLPVGINITEFALKCTR